jgi:hypothetical protein
MVNVELKPAPKLSSAQLEQVSEAIVDAFDVGELTRILKFKWGIILGNYIDLRQGFYGVVGDLIGWTERRGKTLELVLLICAERPGNTAVQQVGHALGINAADALRKYDLTKQTSEKPALEAMVARHSRFVDYGQFLSRFRAIGNRVCRIETPTVLGTGFLVGPNRVLTNFHVIETAAKSNEIAQMICRFNYRADGHGGTATTAGEVRQEPIVIRLGREQPLATSPYGQSDISGRGEPKAEELDYALLQLVDHIGEQAVGDDDRRGWFNLQTERPLLAIRDFVIVPQHAEGRKLEVAWGSVLNFSSLGTRVRYDTSTGAGSSGAPCLTVDLEIFGLHHARDPSANPQFNQAIPLELIARDLESKNLL